MMAGRWVQSQSGHGQEIPQVILMMGMHGENMGRNKSSMLIIQGT